MDPQEKFETYFDSAKENFKTCSEGKCEACKYKNVHKECRVILRAIHMLRNPEFYEAEHT